MRETKWNNFKNCLKFTEMEYVRPWTQYHQAEWWTVYWQDIAHWSEPANFVSLPKQLCGLEKDRSWRNLYRRLDSETISLLLYYHLFGWNSSLQFKLIKMVCFWFRLLPKPLLLLLLPLLGCSLGDDFKTNERYTRTGSIFILCGTDHANHTCQRNDAIYLPPSLLPFLCINQHLTACQELIAL